MTDLRLLPSPALRAYERRRLGNTLEPAALAAHPGKAVGQHPVGQELAKLSRDELGQAGPVGPVGSGAQELIQVIPDDPVEHARFRVSRLVALPGTAYTHCVAPTAKRANAQKAIQHKETDDCGGGGWSMARLPLSGQTGPRLVSCPP